MEQDNLTLTLKQKKKMNRFKKRRYQMTSHTLDRAVQVTLIRLHTGHNRLNSHMHIRVNLVPSPALRVEQKIKQNTSEREEDYTVIILRWARLNITLL